MTEKTFAFLECPKCKINYAICNCGNFPKEKTLSENYVFEKYGKVYPEEDVKKAIERLKGEAVDVTGNGVLFIRIDKIDKIFGEFK